MLIRIAMASNHFKDPEIQASIKKGTSDEADTFICSELNVVANTVSQHRVGVSDPDSSHEEEKEVTDEVVKTSNQVNSATKEASSPILHQEEDCWGPGVDSPQL